MDTYLATLLAIRNWSIQPHEMTGKYRPRAVIKSGQNPEETLMHRFTLPIEKVLSYRRNCASAAH